MTKVIGLSVTKGGVGKTTLTCAFADALAITGYKCLVIDLDGQCNATSLLANRNEESTAVKFLVDVETKEEALACIKPSKYKNIDIITGSKAMYETEIKLAMYSAEQNITGLLRDSIEPIRGAYDFIFIDKNGTKGMLDKMYLQAVEEVICPIEYDNFNYTGILDLQYDIADAANNGNSNIALAGIFFNRVKGNSPILLRQLKIQYIDRYAKIFKTNTIRDSIVVSESNTKLIPLFHYKKDAPVCEDIYSLIKEFGWADKKHLKLLKDYMRGKYNG